MRVSWVLIYDWLGYVYFLFSLETWLSYVHSVTTRVLLRIKQLVLCIHLPSVILNGFFTFTLGLPIIWRAIRQHLSHPRRTKAKVSSSPVTTPHSLFQTLVRSLSLSFRSGNVLHLNDAMLVPKVSLSKNGIGWTTLWWSPKLCAIFTPTSSVLSRIYTRIMS